MRIYRSWVARGLLWGCLAMGGAAGLGGLGLLPGEAQAGGLIPNTNLPISSSWGVPLEKLVYWGAYAGAAYLILDPWAPNWEIEQAPLADDYVHISMKMRRFYAGGAGEARQVFQRRARELMRYGEFDGYDIQEYSESIESSVLGSRRVASGVIHLTHKRPVQKGEAAEAAEVTEAGNAPPARSTSASATKPRS